MWPWWVKIPTVDFTNETLAIDDTYGDDAREIVVLVMEVDKVANMVAEIPYDEESDHSNKAVRKTPEIESGHKVSEEVKWT